MEENKVAVLKSWLRVFATYSLVSFLWVGFVAMGMNDNNHNSISVFADNLVVSNIAIMFYSLVYGFSWLLMRVNNLSTAAKYSLHILVNYVASMICAYALFANLKDNPEITTTTWIAVILVATFVFFVVYGIASLVVYLVKKKLA